MTELLERAAAARKAAVRAPADKPRERRCSEFTGPLTKSRAVTKHPLEIRSAATGGGEDFTGYASITETPYEMYDMFGPYSEVVTRGAFNDTLKTDGLDVPLVLNHESMRRIARTTNGSLLLAEDDIGLRSDAPNLDPTDVDVAYILPKVKKGLIDEMSFRFAIDAGQWSPDYTEYRINAVDINRGDVSIVGYGANPYTSAQFRSLMGKVQNSRALDPQDVNMLTQALALFTAIDNIVDEAQETLSTYLKVPNPDADEAITELAQSTLQQLRSHERLVRRELHSRGMQPAMSFLDILSA